MMRRGGAGGDNLHGEDILGSHLGASPLNSLNLSVQNSEDSYIYMRSELFWAAGRSQILLFATVQRPKILM